MRASTGNDQATKDSQAGNWDGGPTDWDTQNTQEPADWDTPADAPQQSASGNGDGGWPDSRW